MSNIDCRAMADGIIARAADLVAKHPDPKTLLILYAGDDPASAAYMRGKIKDCARCGIPVQQIECKTEDALRYNVGVANMQPQIGGIIIQLPLPPGWDADKLTQMVAPEKDVDGFISGSLFKPCTPEGIMHILRRSLRRLSGSSILLIGKGKLIGQPLIPMLLDAGCTLTIAHSRTRHLDALLAEQHDAVITGVGKPGLIDLERVRAKVIVDAGISRGADGKLHGDCRGETEAKITPVPGGVGLITRAMLMDHMSRT